MTPRDLLTTVIELLGLAAIVWGVYLFEPRVAPIVGGLFAVYIGYTLAAPPAKDPDR